MLGLLQTEGYARTIFTARRPLLNEETIEQRVAVRLDRQQIFTHWPPPAVTAVIEESVLLRAIGGEQVQREQVHPTRKATDGIRRVRERQPTHHGSG
ncbi:Scr1 family TA system antitoxin-like transcriptional regulator [Streptomyces canarius]